MPPPATLRLMGKWTLGVVMVVTVLLFHLPPSPSPPPPHRRPHLSTAAWTSDDDPCPLLHIDVHKPYACSIVDQNNLKTWLKKHQDEEFETVGVVVISRHCSRYSVRSQVNYSKLYPKFSSSSPIYSIIKNQTTGFYPFGQLTNAGKEEAKLLGRKFSRDFGEFVSKIHNKNQVRARSSPIQRCQDTLNLFAQSSLDIPLDVTIAKYLNFDFEKNSSLDDHEIRRLKNYLEKNINSKLAKQMLINSELSFSEANAMLTAITAYDTLNNHSLLDATLGKEICGETNYYREYRRYKQSSINNIKANKTIKELVKSLLEDFEWIAAGNEMGEKRLVLDFTHDTNIIALMDFLGFSIPNEENLRKRGIYMCSNIKIIFLKSKRDLGAIRVLFTLNDNIKEYLPNSEHSTYSYEEVRGFFERQI